MTQTIGWISSALLIATLVAQVYRQWKSRTTEGVSIWLYIGQVAASTGFAVYSWLLGNPVFVVANFMGLLTAILGLGIYLHSRRCERKHKLNDTPSRERAASPTRPMRAVQPTPLRHSQT